MKQLLREPLLHFLVLGAVLFAAASLAGGQKDRGQDQIVVTPERIAHLATGFSRSRSRQPTTEEMRGLIQDHVREEVYYRRRRRWGLIGTTSSFAGACARSWNSSPTMSHL
jgi:hypothetical protein